MNALARYLKDNGIRRSAFAIQVGISPARVSQLCRGETPSLLLALRIAEASNGAIAPADLVTNEAAPEPAQ